MEDEPTQATTFNKHWLDSAVIQNFRGFSALEIGSLARINLIAGYNNVGKTALLEAMIMAHSQLNANFLLQSNTSRGVRGFAPIPQMSHPTPWDAWFHDFHTERPIHLSLADKSGQRTDMSMRFVENIADIDQQFQPLVFGLIAPGQPSISEPPSMSTDLQGPIIIEYHVTGPYGDFRTFTVMSGQGGIRSSGNPNPILKPAAYQPANEQFNPNEFAQRYGSLDIRKQIGNLLKTLQLLEPRLRDIKMIVTPSGPLLHGDLGLSELLPIRLMGEGVNRMANLIVDASAVQGGLLLIDEIENGFHYSVLDRLWTAIDEATRTSGTQFFATTHSLECIRAAHRYFSGKLQLSSSHDEFRVFRLDRVKADDPMNGDRIEPTSFDLETLGDALKLGFEVR